jgi:hypothetical protein
VCLPPSEHKAKGEKSEVFENCPLSVDFEEGGSIEELAFFLNL